MLLDSMKVSLEVSAAAVQFRLSACSRINLKGLFPNLLTRLELNLFLTELSVRPLS